MTNKRRVLSALALVLMLSLSQSMLGQKKNAASSDSIKIPFETYKLPNGLTVILSEDHTTPTVAVDVWYHVGSKNELPGRTGFAHLFEHVMFTGSGHVPYGLHDKLTEGVGGGNNGSTTNDRTNYFETIPSNYLESALWLESDRMGYLLDTLDIAKLNAQRDVVKNERRQSYDNQPYGRVSEIFSAAMYPKDHPYSWPVIGSMTDLSAASEEDVKAFFRIYYAPNNATLAVVGDFDPAQTKAWIQKYFVDLPQGKTVERPKVALGNLTASKRLVYEDRVQVPRLYIQWPTIGFKHDDDYALSVLSSIVSGSRTARLTKALVYDTQKASQVFAFQNSAEDVGVFQVIVIPRPEATLTDLETAVDQVLQKFVSEGPTAEELQKAKSGLELGFLRGLESNLGKANQLISGAVFYDNAGQFRTDYQKTMAVTAADVKRVAQQYLSRSRIVLSVVPKGKRDQASKAAESEAVSLVTGNERGGKQ
ncbi:MAG TPA: pitrilysin family protein [Pyrinomonadaceae bacterium]|nr:pitrilysin family protein [Pyrinomonadaceae bacterium]